MRRAPTLLAAALAALSLGVAACGDDEEEPSTQTQATPEATEAAGVACVPVVGSSSSSPQAATPRERAARAVANRAGALLMARSESSSW